MPTGRFRLACSGCKATIQTPYSSRARGERFAHQRGWRFDGMANIICAECARFEPEIVSLSTGTARDVSRRARAMRKALRLLKHRHRWLRTIKPHLFQRVAAS